MKKYCRLFLLLIWVALLVTASVLAAIGHAESVAFALLGIATVLVAHAPQSYAKARAPAQTPTQTARAVNTGTH